MAIAKGQQSNEGTSRILYMGIGAVKVLAVNPNKKEMEEFYGREMEKDPEYLSKVKIEDKEYDSVRINFVIRTVAEKNNNIEVTANHTFFLQKRYRQGSQSGKYQIIDKYGRTAWATRADIEAKQIPMYSNGPANIDADYRPAYVGEEDLTLFIKNYLNIPNIQSYVDGKWVPNTKVNAADCEVRLDNIEDYFKGDFKELKEVISYQPENLVKVPFGVRTTEDNRQYQTTYTQMCLKNAVTDYSKFAADYNSRKASGAYATTEFDALDLHEYIVDPTKLNPTIEDAAAAAQAGADCPW